MCVIKLGDIDLKYYMLWSSSSCIVSNDIDNLRAAVDELWDYVNLKEEECVRYFPHVN